MINTSLICMEALYRETKRRYLESSRHTGGTNDLAEIITEEEARDLHPSEVAAFGREATNSWYRIIVHDFYIQVINMSHPVTTTAEGVLIPHDGGIYVKSKPDFLPYDFQSQAHKYRRVLDTDLRDRVLTNLVYPCIRKNVDQLRAFNLADNQLHQIAHNELYIKMETRDGLAGLDRLLENAMHAYRPSSAGPVDGATQKYGSHP